MSTQPQSSQQKQSVDDMADECIRILDGVMTAFSVQVLENTDSLERHALQQKVSSGNQDDKADSKPDTEEARIFRSLMQTMVKESIRKQIGRCRNARRLLIEMKSKLKKESTAHGT